MILNYPNNQNFDLGVTITTAKLIDTYLQNEFSTAWSQWASAHADSGPPPDESSGRRGKSELAGSVDGKLCDCWLDTHFHNSWLRNETQIYVRV